MTSKTSLVKRTSKVFGEEGLPPPPFLILLQSPAWNEMSCLCTFVWESALAACLGPFSSLIASPSAQRVLLLHSRLLRWSLPHLMTTLRDGYRISFRTRSSSGTTAPCVTSTTTSFGIERSLYNSCIRLVPAYDRGSPRIWFRFKNSSASKWAKTSCSSL